MRTAIRHLRLRSQYWARRLRDKLPPAAERGATTLEYVLLMAAIVLPGYFVIRLGLATLFAHYRMVTTMNGLPLP